MKEDNVIDFSKENDPDSVAPKDITSRVLMIGTARHTIVMAMDKKGAGNANHRYQIVASKNQYVLGEVEFQDGPIKESGVNGIHNEDLIAIVIDRLEGFQNSNYGCAENAMAMIKLEEALMWIQHRTERRMREGVEGTHVV